MDEQNPQQPAPKPTDLPPESISTHHFTIKKWEVIIALAAIGIVGGLLFYFGGASKNALQGRGDYSQVFSLVPDKISQSAAITVSLPKNVKINSQDAKDKISFEPSVAGVWAQGKSDGELIFHPAAKLDIGKYYAIAVSANGATLEKDFLIDEDPKVVSVFPAADTEASEESEITIVFNRPMVPLTTLDTLFDKDIPVEVSPVTPGKFKWITTRNLQFIPVSRLQRSSHYTVSVKSGFVSMDGLVVSPFTHAFTTRPLRYESGTIHHDGVTLYSEPVRIQFNQPVSIDRTKSSIQIVKVQNNENVSFVVEYGKRHVYNSKTNTTEEFIDKSVLELYSREDRHGRKKFWDFDTQYKVTISHAVPLEGDSELAESRSIIIRVPEVIASLSADSPRSKYAEPGLFDPQGRLWVSFYEDINKDASIIKADGLQEVGYGDTCKLDEDGNEVRIGGGCERIPDKKKIYLKFRPDGWGRAQAIPVQFKNIFNTSGLQLNAEIITKTITTYPNLKITRTVPASGNQNGKLTELKICTTNPLTPATEENFSSRLQSNIGLGKWDWEDPFRIGAGFTGTPCAVGEFENTVNYGLMPESFYRISLTPQDDFGQRTEKIIELTSEKIPSIYRRFHHLQKAYNVTTPERTKLTYAAENLEYVNMHICQVSAATMLAYLDYDGRPKAGTPGENLSCIRTIQKRIDLPKKYWSNNYFQIDLKEYVPDLLGYYVLSFSNPDYREEIYNYRTNRTESGLPVYERTFLNVTKLAVQEKKIERSDEWYGEAEKDPELTRSIINGAGGNLYWVTGVGTLAAVSGAKVDLYQKKDSAFTLADSSFTDASGVARTKVISLVGAAVVSKDKDSTIVSGGLDKFQWASQARSAERTYIYTDRPIYRPGQEVFLKGIYRIGYDANYEIFKDKKALLEVFNSKNESVFKQDADINGYGTFNAHFVLDAHAPLGTYRIQGLGGYFYFDVEEYVPSPFKVELSSGKDEYIAGDTMNLGIDANYYFGVPVEGGKVAYSILSQDYYFDRYHDGYFQFGSDWYYSYGGFYGDSFIMRGKTTLDGNGKAKIEQLFDFQKFFKEESRNKSKIFIVRVTVKNKTGQSVSQEKSIIVHRGEFYVGINLDKGYFGKGEPNTLRIKSVDTKGKEKPVNNIAVEISKIRWEYFKRREVDGGYYYESQKKKEIVQQFTAGTDSKGNFSKEFSVDQEGEFEITTRSIDGRGNAVISTQDFYVYGSGAVTIRPTNNESLDLAVEKSKVDVGDKIKIIIKSPYTKAKALVSIERGKIFDYSIIDIDRNLVDYTFEVKEAHIPDVYVSVIVLSPRPEVKFGQIHFVVNTKEKEVFINVKPSKNHYLPGEQVRLSIETKDSFGRALPAEISVAVADLSVLALKGNPKKNPVAFFYGGMPLTVTTASNIKNILYEAEIPLGTKGGGGGEPEDLAKKKRGIFKDTAYWEGVVETGKDGKAEVTFTLPDNLTTWQTEVLGVTKDTKVGVGYSEFVSQKDLMVTPLRPRFAIPGDEFMIGAKIFNQTDTSQKLAVSLTSPTLEAKGDVQTSVTVKARDTSMVYFPVVSPEKIQDGEHTFTISAKNDSYEDTVENSFPIKRNDTYESVATAYFTSNAHAKEYVFLPDNIVKDKGGVTLKTSATLAVFLSDALNYLVSYPYGCSEQIASKLSSIAIVKRGLSVPNVGDKFSLKDVEFAGKKYSVDDVVEIGLARIYSNQTAAGGFTYYRGMEPSFHLTLHIVNAIEELKRAGYAVNDSVLNRAAQFLYSQIVSDYRLNQDKNLVILTTYALSRLDGFNAAQSVLRNKILDITVDKKFVREDISNISLAYLAIILTKGYPVSVKNDVFKTLENRITIDARGAFLREFSGQWLWDYYETPVKDTALLLKALVADRSQNPIMDKVLRWILRSRAKDGAWGSTNNTVSVIDALVDFLQWKMETESEFSLSLSLDGKEKGTFYFNKDTILNTFETFLPVADFPSNSVHSIEFAKKNQNNLPNAFYYDMLLKYFLPIDSIPPRDEGFAVVREFYRLDDEQNKNPVSESKVGEVLKGHLTVIVPKSRNFVSVEDFIPAGMELVNLKLATEDQSLKKNRPYPYGGGDDYYDGEGQGRAKGNSAVSGNSPDFLAALVSGFKNLFAFSFGGFVSLPGELADEEYSRVKHRQNILYPDAEESHDDRLFLFKERLAPGVYEYDYFVRSLIPGKYHHLPAVASEMYFPENFGRTRGEYFFIKQ